jgi:hypothetical protein
MSAFSTIPLKILNSSGDLKQLTTAEEALFANEGGLGLVGAYDSVGARYGGSLTLTNTANDSDIGVYRDTFYTSPIGTHPGTSISSGSTTTTLRQMTDAVTQVPFNGAVPKLVVCDSDGALYEMDSASYNALALRVNDIAVSTEGVGSFRLSATQPTSEYVKWIDAVFTDTKVNGSTDYHIWRKETVNVDPEAYYPIKKIGDQDYQEMTASEVGEIGNGMIQQGYYLNGVGEYQLRSDSDGAPTASGTWEARGTALDTKNTVQNVQYATVLYTSPQYARQYTGQYLGTYTNLRYSTLFQNFVGIRQVNYAGVRNYTNQYVGIRSFTNTFVGVRPQTQQFVGQRTFVGSRYYVGSRAWSGQFTGNFSGVRYYTGQFVADRTFAGARDFTGLRYFSGTRVLPYTNTFTGPRSQDFLGSRQVNYTGPRPYAGVRYFTGLRYFAGVREFLGTRYFSGARQFATDYAGQRSYTSAYQSGTPVAPMQWGTAPIAFGSVVPGSFAQESYTGTRPYGIWYAGTRQFLANGASFPVGNPAANNTFTGTRGSNYTGIRTYAGFRYFTGLRQYSSNFTGNYTGIRGFESSPIYFARAVQNFTSVNPIFPQFNYLSFGAWVTDYTDELFLGWAAITFVGTRNFPFEGVRNWATAQNFVRPVGAGPIIDANTGHFIVPGNFVGQRTFVGTRAYSGNFAGQFAGVRYYLNNTGFLHLGQLNNLQFVSDRTFAGVRAFSNDFVGVRSSPQTFGGSRPYSGNFIGPATITFAGTRAVLYTGYYSGQYTGQYTSTYTSQYSAQYTGQTVVAIPGTIRTYTLYVRVSAT